MADEGKVMIIFPTRRNLERLALFDSFEAAAAHAAEFPVRTVLTYIDERPDGKFLSIPDGHGYPVIAGDQVVGEITSGSWSPTLGKAIALAYVPTELARPGTELAVRIRGKDEPGVVVKRPFHRRG